MPFQFETPPAYQNGALFLGLDEAGREVGILTERHALTIAGAGAGKGAGLIIPNLKRWPHNVLCIDPAGENVAETWQDREAAGQQVVILDPFRAVDYSRVPERLRGSCNLLAAIKPDSLTVREDIRVVADGLVMRYKAEDATWDNGAVSVLAGLIAYVLADDAFPDEKHLPAVRQLLNLPPDARTALFEAMSKMEGFGSLAKAAAVIGLSPTKKAQSFVEGAVDNTEWLDSAPMADLLSASTFSLSELKTGRCSVFLVLPPDYLVEHGRFLRLFVRAALDAMLKGGKVGRKTLFLLDEFFSLGHIDQVHKAAGLMRKNGVHLWPFLQDLGQLTSLYGQDGAHTFFGNADAHIFFGNTDGPTLDYVSGRIGKLTRDEIREAPPANKFVPRATEKDWKSSGYIFMDRDTYFAMVGPDDENARREQEHLNALARQQYDHEMKHIGTPRLTPQQVAALTGRGDGDAVARSMIVFGKKGQVHNIRLAPYFEAADYITPQEQNRRLVAASHGLYWSDGNFYRSTGFSPIRVDDEGNPILLQL